MQVLAIIPARSGSKVVPHKNIRFMLGHPLLAWSIAAAKVSKYINRVLVSTDSEEYAEIARRYGAEVPFLRPTKFAQDDSQDIEFITHALKWLSKHEGSVPNYLAHLRPTCPNRNPATIDQAVEVMLNDTVATSLISVQPVAYPPSKYYKLSDSGLLQGYMSDEYNNLPRQSCPQAYKGNGHIDLYLTENILQNNSLLGSNALPFICPNPGDIDSEEDFLSIEASLSISASTLFKYLSAFGDE